MSVFRFDRDAAEITKKGNWSDADTFNSIAGGAKELSGVPESAIVPLSNHGVPGVCVAGQTSNGGQMYLLREVLCAVELANTALLELSDGCSALGSGIAGASSMFSAADEEASRRFEFLCGEWKCDA